MSCMTRYLNIGGIKTKKRQKNDISFMEKWDLIERELTKSKKPISLNILDTLDVAYHKDTPKNTQEDIINYVYEKLFIRDTEGKR